MLNYNEQKFFYVSEVEKTYNKNILSDASKA